MDGWMDGWMDGKRKGKKSRKEVKVGRKELSTNRRWIKEISNVGIFGRREGTRKLKRFF